MLVFKNLGTSDYPFASSHKLGIILYIYIYIYILIK
jgi:hypothetical protein